jgi:MFS transporter, DHA1 family, tetracycline resistance protein
MTDPAKLPRRRAAIAFVMVTVVLDMLAMAMIIPVLPRLVLEFSGDDTAAASGVLGLFGTAWNLMQFVCSPIIGALSDRFGRRPVILMSNFGLGLDYVLMALAPGLALLFVGRIISGITPASRRRSGGPPDLGC